MLVKRDVKIVTQQIKENKYELATKYLIYYMLKDKKAIKIYNSSKVFIPNEKYRLLAKEISCFYLNNGFIKVADLMNSFVNDDDIIKLIGEIEKLDLRDDYDVNKINDCINVLKQYTVNYETKNLDQKLHNTDSYDEKIALAQRLLDLKKEQSKVMEEK